MVMWVILQYDPHYHLWMAPVRDTAQSVVNRRLELYYERRGRYMRFLCLCTYNYNRSVIEEFCLINYKQTKHINGIEVASAGFNSNSDISKFSNVHFKRMNELGIDTSNFVRNQFREQFFQEFDVIIAMGKEHKEYVKQNFGR